MGFTVEGMDGELAFSVEDTQYIAFYPLGPLSFFREEFSCLWSGMVDQGWEFRAFLAFVIIKALSGKEGEDLGCSGCRIYPRLPALCSVLILYAHLSMSLVSLSLVLSGSISSEDGLLLSWFGRRVLA